MSNEMVSHLLEQLVGINEAILTELSEMRSDIAEIKSEMNWVSDHSFASTLINHVDEISSKVDSVTEIAEELNWSKDLSFAKTVVGSLDEISSALASIDSNTSGL